MARAVERNDVPVEVVRRSVRRLIEDKGFTVRDATRSPWKSGQEHSVEMSARRLIGSVWTGSRRGTFWGDADNLRELRDALNDLLEGW